MDRTQPSEGWGARSIRAEGKLILKFMTEKNFKMEREQDIAEEKSVLEGLRKEPSFSGVVGLLRRLEEKYLNFEDIGTDKKEMAQLFQEGVAFMAKLLLENARDAEENGKTLNIHYLRDLIKKNRISLINLGTSKEELDELEKTMVLNYLQKMIAAAQKNGNLTPEEQQLIEGECEHFNLSLKDLKIDPADYTLLCMSPDDFKHKV